MIRIRVDQDNCIGAGQCVRAAPEVFDQREEDGIVVLLLPEAPDHLAACVKKAAQLCPAQVIYFETVESNNTDNSNV